MHDSSKPKSPKANFNPLEVSTIEDWIERGNTPIPDETDLPVKRVEAERVLDGKAAAAAKPKGR